MVFQALKSKLNDIRVAALFLVVSLMLICACIWAYHEFMTTPPYVDPERYPVRGIDISAHNGMMNLDAAAKDGIDFVFIKASEGETFRDDNFRLNYRKAEHAGLKIGVYHFFRFDKDGVSQAINLLRTVGSRKPELGLAIDVEKQGNPANVPDSLVKDRLSSMVDYLNLLGHRITFYTNKEGYYDYIADLFPGAPLWICSFSSNPINAEWTFWQFNHHGKVRGIRGDVDLNAFCGSREDWEDYLNGAQWPYTESPSHDTEER